MEITGVFLLFSINMQNLVELSFKLTKILNLGISPLFRRRDVPKHVSAVS